MNANARRFSCTACGKCCTRGPEMELGEVTALADRFIVRLLFRLHSVPLQAVSGEAHRHLRHFSAHEEHAGGRALHLTISALPFHAAKDKCPALDGTRCGLYERRPLACRTVPFHYAIAARALARAFDQLVKTPGYLCDTSSAAPVVFRGGKVVDPSIAVARQEAVTLAQAQREWKTAMVAVLQSRPPTPKGSRATRILSATPTPAGQPPCPCTPPGGWP
jgi:Fe-S-cluster containining protein